MTTDTAEGADFFAFLSGDLPAKRKPAAQQRTLIAGLALLGLILAAAVAIPPGYTVSWSGQFEYMQRAAQRLRIIVPLTVVLIFLLLYLNFRNVRAPLVVMLSIPFALVGGIWLVYGYGFNLSVAVAVGFIALSGVATEIGVLVLTFIDQELDRVRRHKASASASGTLTAEEVMQAVIAGTSERVRPIAMTAVAIIAGLLPIMWGSGTGSEVMRRIAAPMLGGMLTTTLLCLLVLPVIYGLVLCGRERLGGHV